MLRTPISCEALQHIKELWIKCDPPSAACAVVSARDKAACCNGDHRCCNVSGTVKGFIRDFLNTWRRLVEAHVKTGLLRQVLSFKKRTNGKAHRHVTAPFPQ